MSPCDLKDFADFSSSHLGTLTRLNKLLPPDTKRNHDCGKMSVEVCVLFPVLKNGVVVELIKITKPRLRARAETPSSKSYGESDVLQCNLFPRDTMTEHKSFVTITQVLRLKR